MKPFRADNVPDALRRKLMLGLPGSLALMTPLGMVACGGSDYSPAAPAGSALPAIDRSVVALKLELPADTGVSLHDSRLMTGNNVSEVAADGTAGAVLLRGEPQMGYLIGADGRLLLMGAVDAARTVLNSRTTAEALIYVASEVALLEPALQIALRKVLQSHAIVEPVRVAVEAALLRGGITDQDPELMAALIAAESVVRRRTPAAAASAAQRARALKLTIAPADYISGVRVKRDAAFNSVALQNTFRRRAYAWIEQVGYFDSNGKEVSLGAPPVPLKDFDISATTALSFDNLVIRVGDFLAGLAADIGLIGDYQQGTFPFTATESAPVYLPIFPEDAQSSLYRTRVIGVGSTPADALNPLTTKESDKLDTLMVETVWEDIVVPTMQTLVLPLISDRLGKAFQGDVSALWLAAIGVDVVNVAFLTKLLPNTWDRVKKGNASEAIGEFWKEFFSSGVFGDLMKGALNSLIVASVGADTIVDSTGKLVAVNLLAKDDLAKSVGAFQATLGNVAKIIVVVKAVATVADFAAMAADWARSEQRSEFALSSSGTTITFTPAAVSAMPGLSVPLTAALGETADIGAGSVIRYDWSVSGSAGGTLRNPANQATGTTISTSTDTVDYVAAAGAAPGAADQVNVKAILTDIVTSSGGVIAVAQVPATVTISAVRLTPASVDFKLEAGQRQDFSVEFSTAFGSPLGLVYEWTCPSVFGFISDNAQLSSSAVPTFRSALPKVVYASGAVAVGGEIEVVKVRVLRITSAPGDVTETTETVATLESRVRYGAIELMMSPAKPMDVPTDTRFGLSASVKNPLPEGSTVTWAWTVSGPGALSNQTPFNGGAGCSVDVVTGSAEGTATVSVQATVLVPGSPPATVVTDPVSAVLNVKKGLLQVVLEASGGVFACTDPLACGVSAYTAYIVPRFEKATGYSAMLSGFSFAGCNRTQTWDNIRGPVGDRGGCLFPVTYHPHTSLGRTNQWAVWVGFGGALDAADKCVVTITLAP